MYWNGSKPLTTSARRPDDRQQEVAGLPVLLDAGATAMTTSEGIVSTETDTSVPVELRFSSLDDL